MSDETQAIKERWYKQVRRACSSRDPLFLAAASNVLEQLRHVPDNQALESSSVREQKYLLCHLNRGWYTFHMGTQHLNLTQGRHVILDIGTSPLTFIYRQCAPNAEIRTIDLTGLLQRRCEGAQIVFRQCDLVKDPLPFEDGSVDVVLFTEVLEHIPVGPGRLFQEICRVLRPRGRLLLSVPNVASLKNRLKLLIGRALLKPVYAVLKADEPIAQERGERPVHGYSHIREYTMAETLDIVRHYGFRPLEKMCVNPFRFPPAHFTRLKRIAFPFYAALSGVVPNAKFCNMVLAEKCED